MAGPGTDRAPTGLNSDGEWRGAPERERQMDLFSDLYAALSVLTRMPWSALFVFTVNTVLSLLLTVATLKLTDVEKMRGYIEEIKDWREKQMRAMRMPDTPERAELMEELMAEQPRIVRMNVEIAGSRCKPYLIFLIPFMVVFTLLANIFGTTPVAILPFNIHEVFWFFDGWIGTRVQGGFGLYYWSWYVLSGMSTGALTRRAFGLDPATGF